MGQELANGSSGNRCSESLLLTGQSIISFAEHRGRCDCLDIVLQICGLHIRREVIAKQRFPSAQHYSTTMPAIWYSGQRARSEPFMSIRSSQNARQASSKPAPIQTIRPRMSLQFVHRKTFIIEQSCINLAENHSLVNPVAIFPAVKSIQNSRS